ncbi:hypothetical protein QMK19_35220 [Streptomyces sp. H10-C2]|uniref:LexA family protein n=1 Tax=unclassified Streptomyces TaxID=2593676 RepID=UPI0024B9484E|nr:MULTISPECIES: hypothetical protein [unclassified Streptomyces]MDJ0345886.1 hypothetical protein [Streptomyces sp. PH10-H1]MDJ0374735.1 hypothetical protein [Streptomyces sp. H10-C2]
MTDRQEQILHVIREWDDLNGYPPTVREIGAAVGLRSPGTVAHHLGALERLGLLTRDSGRHRSYRVRLP